MNDVAYMNAEAAVRDIGRLVGFLVDRFRTFRVESAEVDVYQDGDPNMRVTITVTGYATQADVEFILAWASEEIGRSVTFPAREGEVVAITTRYRSYAE